jgi:ABC-type nitrate/sulfonate/bicarbonate transport system substrate-binding protein
MQKSAQLKEDLTYSAVMRDLRKNNPEKVEEFMKEFKKAFDSAVENKIDNIEKTCLFEVLNKIKYEKL